MALSPAQCPEAKRAFHAPSHLQSMLYWCSRYTSGVPVEKAHQSVSSCCSSGSVGGQWGFGNEFTQLSLGEKQGVLGMES